MRQGDRENQTTNGLNQMMGVDFHDFLQKEQGLTNLELAEEFNLSLNHVRKLKKKINR
ncbi:winged helix-turn-helix domain-containing protein [Fictibacillus sp. Mic-4]|uniref:winged helix-turn-helix domain-containing protein n=1 Tax=Fictibacillus TaxID=1329200 RepID=UPI00042128CC|nr:winged helix-turn-helix domain-containing protein [Fictibacillus gelatini]